MTTWFTADTHFGHANILKYCERPFRDVHEMEAVLCAAWSTRVEPEDTIYHLGDFCFGGPRNMERLLAALPGRKHLIRGNHDPTVNRCRRVPGWESVDKQLDVELDGVLVVLNHWPLEEWDGDLAGSFHLHGHCHGTRSSPDMRRMDVGVDPRGYCPISWQEVKMVLSTVPLPEPPARPYGPRP